MSLITKKQLQHDLEKIGVRKGDLLNIKASVKSIGKIDGGVKTLIEALLETVGDKGTIVTDSFINSYLVYRLLINRKINSNKLTPSYAGILANEMIKHPKSERSLHPIQKFSAIGALAKDLMKNHTDKSYAYDVLRVMAESGGRNLKIGSDEKVVGVGTTHVAIGLLGLKQKRIRTGVNYLSDEGQLKQFMINWAGGCAKGFYNFNDLYDRYGAVISKGYIGNAPCKLTDMKKTLDIEIKKLNEDPTYFMCKDPLCKSCRLSWEFSKDSVPSFILKNFFNISLKSLVYIVALNLFGVVLPSEDGKAK
jgi:aminoglycoside N3'-acetyltransferase